MKINAWRGMLISLAFLGLNAQASELLWLSDTAPDAAAAEKQQRSHGGPIERGRGGVFRKRLWVRSGDTPNSSAYASPAGDCSAQVLSPDKSGLKFSQPAKDSFAQLVFDMPDEGFYNAYLTREQMVDGHLQVSTAKAEVLKHSCREGHDHVDALIAPSHRTDVPLEIVRQRLPDENFHTRAAFGDQMNFLVLSRGKPVSGATVTLHTSSGWSNSTLSDENGQASFTLIRDYFPDWEMFEARHAQEYLAVASLERDERGIHQGEAYTSVSYQATLPGRYYPSSRDYESYAYGLGIGLFGLTFSGTAVYLFRRRRVRPYREVRFDD